MKAELCAQVSKASEFLELLRPGGTWELVAIDPDRKQPTRARSCTTRQEVQDFIERNNTTMGVYYSINPTKAPLNKKAAKKDIARVEYLHVDADPHEGESPEQCWARLQPLITAFDKPPSFVTISGNGAHLLWRLTQPVLLDSAEAIADIEARNQALALAFGAEPVTRNVDRILRVPWTVNWPNEKKRKAGRVAVMSELIAAEDVAYGVAAFAKAEPSKGKSGSNKGAARGQRDPSGSGHGFRFFMAVRAKGMDYEQACQAIMNDRGLAGEWANRVDERQLQRAWQHSGEILNDTWPVLDERALHGLAGEVVATIAPHSEADPVALLLQFHIYFGNAIGRGPFYLVEGTQHFTNLFGVLVGETSKSRKGTSGDRIRQVMAVSWQSWVERRIQSGLSSGEGVIAAVADEVTKPGKDGEEIVVVEGVDDKRLLLDEREFFGALEVMKRPGNIVSRILRDAWDGRYLATLTKHTPLRATAPMISLVGHITADELRARLIRPRWPTATPTGSCSPACGAASSCRLAAT